MTNGTLRLALPAALAALALGTAACGGGDDEGGASGDVELTVSTLAPLSGQFSYYGPTEEKSTNLARDAIVEAIEQAGVDHTLEVTVEDTQSEPQAAVSAARRAIAGGATCIVGGPSTAETLAIAESVTVPEEVVTISPAQTADDTTAVEDGPGYLNRTILPNRLQAPAVADLVEQGVGGVEGKVINLGARNDAYGIGFAEAFREAWEAKGGEIGEEVRYDPELSEYSTEAEQLVKGDPAGWAIFDFPDTFAVMGPALARTGKWDPERTFINEGLYSTSLPQDLSPEVVEGLRGTNPGSPESTGPAVAFNELFTSTPGTQDRQITDAQTFDAVVLCYLAAAAAGSSDGPAMVEHLRAVSGPPGEVYSYEELPEAIEALENGEDIDYEGVAGPIDLDKAGDPSRGVYDLYTYRDGELVKDDEIQAGGAQ